jgi:hypothetical protein
MDPPIPFLINQVISLNTDQRILLKKLLKNFNKAGGGMRGTIFYCAPDSRIQKILTLIELKAELNKFLVSNFKIGQHKPISFVEFGGGFGQMAELVIRELNPKSYTIIDLPLISSLAQYYLNNQNLNFNVNFIGMEDKVNLSNQNINVFISSWAISEINLDSRARIEKYMREMDILFIELQHLFAGIDNYQWITIFLNQNPQFDFNFSVSNRSKRSRVYWIYRNKKS